MNNVLVDQQHMTADEMIDKIGQLYEEQKEIIQAIEFGYASNEQRVRISYSIAELRDIACLAVKKLAERGRDTTALQKSCARIAVGKIAPCKVSHNR